MWVFYVELYVNYSPFSSPSILGKFGIYRDFYCLRIEFKKDLEGLGKVVE
jgi:hypothetical protein